MTHLTPAQLTLLKTYINSVPAWAAMPRNSDAAFVIADALNQPAVPAFIVWKGAVTASEVGEAMNSTEVSGLTTANTNRLMVMAQYSGGMFNPSRADMRAGFDSVFSGAGGALTRVALLLLYKRSAKLGEKVLATGTGSDALPATMGFDGSLSYHDVEAARNS